MSRVISAAGIAITAAVLAMMLGELGGRGARLISVVGLVSLSLFGLDSLAELIGIYGSLGIEGAVEEAARAAMKIVGIGYITGICHDICADMGQRGVANGLLAIGKIEIMLAAAPFITELVGMAIDLM